MTYSEGLSEALHKITFIGLVGYVIILSIIILFIIFKIHFETENEIKEEKKDLMKNKGSVRDTENGNFD